MEKLTFENIAAPIINTDKYQSLKNDYHHGLTRYIHSVKVAKVTYLVTKFLRLDYVSATRGALLHDYFNNKEYLDIKASDKPKIHPFLALNNAKREHKLNMIEQNIIISHMYPIGKIEPIYPESWIVSSVDKLVAIDEFLLCKFKDELILLAIFAVNFLKFKCDFV